MLVVPMLETDADAVLLAVIIRQGRERLPEGTISAKLWGTHAGRTLDLQEFAARTDADGAGDRSSVETDAASLQCFPCFRSRLPPKIDPPEKAMPVALGRSRCEFLR